MGEEGRFVAPGWVLDGQGRLMRELKPHMGRRLPDFDYSQRRIYEITIVLEDRRPILGRLVKRGEGDWAVEPSEIGGIVLACWREITVRWPQVELIEDQLMPEHFHGVLFVKEQLPKGKSLGNIIGSNLFNILFVLGIAGSISPLDLLRENVTDSIICFGVTVLTFVFALTGKKINRLEGVVMLLVYAAYMAFVFLREFNIVAI